LKDEGGSPEAGTLLAAMAAATAVENGWCRRGEMRDSVDWNISR